MTLPVKDGRLLDERHYYQPIFIGNGVVAIVFPEDEEGKTDKVVYYKFERSCIVGNFSFLNPGALYNAVLKKAKAKEAEEQKAETKKVSSKKASSKKVTNVETDDENGEIPF